MNEQRGMRQVRIGRALRAGLVLALLAVPWLGLPAPAAQAAICGGLTGPVTKSGAISSDTTWANNTVYHVLSPVTVQTGVTLTIQAGAVVKFDKGTYLDIQGTLALTSTSLMTNTYTSGAVKFTSLRDDDVNMGCDSNADGTGTKSQRGDWDGLILRDSGAVTGYGVVRYSRFGLDLYNVGAAAFAPTITGWLFDQNYYGVTLQIPAGGAGGDIAAVIQGNTFYSNYVGLLTLIEHAGATARPKLYANTFTGQVAFPIMLLGTSYPVYGGVAGDPNPANTFGAGGVYGNKYRAIAVGGRYLYLLNPLTFINTPWTVDGTLPLVPVGDSNAAVPNFPYAVFNDSGYCQHLNLSAGATLTLPAGTVLKFDTGIATPAERCRFDAFGVLAMPGTATFTSFKDDSVGGDANGDSAATAPAAGDWGYVALYDSASAVTNDVLKYSTYGMYIYNYYGGTLQTPVSGSTFNANQVAGLILESKNGVVSTTVQSSVFLNNLNSGLFIRAWDADVHADVTGGTFTDTAYPVDTEISGAGLITGTISANTFTRPVSGYRNTLKADPGTHLPYFGVARPTLASNTFNAATSYPIYLNGSAYPTYSGNTFTSSRYKGIGLAGTFRQSGTWPIVAGDGGQAFAYVVDATTTLLPYSGDAASTSVTVPAGAVIKFRPAAALVSQGSLLATGTANAHICFTSFKDDTCGGDTNNDGAATAPAKSNWDALYLDDRYYTPPADWPSLAYIDVHYADNGVVMVENFSDNTLACSTLAHATLSNNRVGAEIYGQLYPGENTCAGLSNSTISGNDFGLYFNIRRDALRYTADPANDATGNGNIISTIDAVTFANNGYAVQLTAESGRTGVMLPKFNNVVFQNNLADPLWIAAQAFPTFAGTTFTGNARQAVLIQGLNGGSVVFNNVFNNGININASGTLPRVPDGHGSYLPYVVAGNWKIAGAQTTPATGNDCPNGTFSCPGATVSVPANTVFKFTDLNAYLEVQGELDIQGVSGQPVVFTSLKDDTFLGDTNGDSATTAPTRTDWGGLYLETNGVAPGTNPYTLQYVLVQHARDGLGIYNVYLNMDLFPVVANSQFYENGTGLSLFTASAGSIKDRVAPAAQLLHDNVFANNTTHVERRNLGGGEGTGAVNITAANNCFLPAATTGILNSKTSGSFITAANNWWGSAGGPAAAGQAVSAGVSTSPWLTSAPAFCQAQLSGLQGLIADNSSAPLNNVVVELRNSAGTVIAAQSTNASGSYTFSGLAGGQYTLTPVLSGYTFTPAVRVVSVPPGQTSLNFTAGLGGGGGGGYACFLPLVLR